MNGAAVLTILLATASCLDSVVEPGAYANMRIVGGVDAEAGQFPWMVSLRARYGNDHFCGASIINSKWILSAAHCMQAHSDLRYAIAVVGSILLSSGGTAYNLSRIVYHKGYHEYNMKNDVVVIELVEEIQFNEFVQPIELDTEFVDVVDSQVAGWGLLAIGERSPDNLQFANVQTMTLRQCRRYDNLHYISDEEICTASIADQLGFCHGDSGSALVAGGKQIGIVSWGSPPCASGTPEVYTRVSSFIEWINTATST